MYTFIYTHMTLEHTFLGMLKHKTWEIIKLRHENRAHPCDDLNYGSDIKHQWLKIPSASYLKVYRIFPSFQIRRSWLGVVIQWASAVLELRKIVSGIHINPTMLLFRVSIFIVLLNRRRLSVHVWAKNMSIWYSCNKAEGEVEGFLLVNFLYKSLVFLHVYILTSQVPFC